MTRIKVCGITRQEDALVAEQSGADAIGLVFYEKSPRAVTIKQAQQVVKALPPFLTKVALFVHPKQDEVESVLNAVNVDCLQFHGDEAPAFCEQFAKPYIKAIRMRPGVELSTLCGTYANASALLVDTYVPGVYGGTGQAFDWQTLPSELQKPIILAGGLGPQNVGQAIKLAQPFAVDVSGGVEAQKGLKSAALIQQFCKAVRQADGRDK